MDTKLQQMPNGRWRAAKCYFCFWAWKTFSSRTKATKWLEDL